jgi:phosphomannomutase
MSVVHIEEMMLYSGVKFGTSGARGLVKDMTDEVCYAYTASFMATVNKECSKVILGHDLRPSSPSIASVCAVAFRDCGKEVVYVGALPTPALAYYAAKLKVPALVVTGSHIPFDRNGLKFYRTSGEITKLDEQNMLHATVQLPEVISQQPLPNQDESARYAYVNRYIDFFGAGALTGLQLAVYEHSSVARDILRDILEGLGAKVLSLGRTDSFVPIDTEAVRSEDIDNARKWAAEYEFDAIISTDGDGDRPLIGDENGKWLRGDVVGILCAKFLKADTVVTPVSSNTALEKCVLFRNVLRTRIGSPYVIDAMESALAQNDGVVAGYEANGGFLLGSNVTRKQKHLKALPTRDAVLPILALLCMAQEQGCKLSALTDSLPQRFTYSNRLQDFPTDKSQSFIARLLADVEDALAVMAPDAVGVSTINMTDGLRITFKTGDVVHLRPSGNAPELRCYTEAETQERAQFLCESCLERISKT